MTGLEGERDDADGSEVILLLRVWARVVVAGGVFVLVVVAVRANGMRNGRLDERGNKDRSSTNLQRRSRHGYSTFSPLPYSFLTSRDVQPFFSESGGGFWW
jgi:hypothetical protein